MEVWKHNRKSINIDLKPAVLFFFFSGNSFLDIDKSIFCISF